MSSVVIYGRTSTKTQKMGYQISSLIDICSEKNWKIIKSFRDDGISGLMEGEERPGLMEMMKFVNETENIDKVVIAEVSRLGRNVDYVKDILSELSRLNISVFVADLCCETLKNGKLDPNVLVMLCDEVGHANREIIKLKSRLKRGYDVYLQSGQKVGRKFGDVETEEKFLFKHDDIIRYLMDGYSFRAIRLITGKSTTTVTKVKSILTKSGSFVESSQKKGTEHILKMLFNDEMTKGINKNLLTMKHEVLEKQPRYVPRT